MADEPASDGSRAVADFILPPFPALRPSLIVQSTSQELMVPDLSMVDTYEQSLSTPLILRSLLDQQPPRPVTRSLAKDNAVALLTGEEHSVKARLRASVKSGTRTRLLGNFENSRSISHDGEDSEPQSESSPSVKAKNKGVPKAQRAARVRRAKSGLHSGSPSRDSTPTSTVVAKVRDRRIRKLPSARPAPTGRPSRRSIRLAKPLTDFHLFNQLPRELQIMVWEAAIDPRVVYLRNRSLPAIFGGIFSGAVQNKQPKWFFACKTSWYVAQLQYQPMFTLLSSATYPYDDTRHLQAMNLNTDIVLLEPCCPGCRAYSCTRHQFLNRDRERVRSIAVQVESPYLMASASPCWLTISLSWPNVETLYMTRSSVTGENDTPKALILVRESEHEKALYKRFLQWKKAEGRYNSIQNIVFVAVANREEGKIQERYQEVPERKTGTPSDIVIG